MIGRCIGKNRRDEKTNKTTPIFELMMNIRKQAVSILLFITILSFHFSVQSQNINDTIAKTPVKEQSDFLWLMRFKPLATVAGIILFNGLNLEVTAVRYVMPKIGIPIDVQFAMAREFTAITILSGIEVVPLTHREKSGLYLNCEIGGLYTKIRYGNTKLSFCMMAHLGYQLVTKKGFVLTPAGDFQYIKTEGIGVHIMLDIGFGIKG